MHRTMVMSNTKRETKRKRERVRKQRDRENDIDRWKWEKRKRKSDRYKKIEIGKEIEILKKYRAQKVKYEKVRFFIQVIFVPTLTTNDE